MVHDVTLLVPTGTAIPPTSTEHADYKPVVKDAEWINSVDFPVVLEADLRDGSYEALYSKDETTRHSRIDKKTVIVDTGVGLHLMYGLVSGSNLGDIVWSDLGGTIANITPV